MSTPLQYVRDYYKVPAEIGRRVKVYGKPGIIAADFGHHIGVTLDTDKPNRVSHYHPVDGVEYLGMGTVRPMTRSQKRYREFVEADSGLTFFEFLKWRHANKERLVELGYAP